MSKTTESPPIAQRIAAKGLIRNADGRLLILREAATYVDGSNTGRYHMPGGRINPGEPFLDGLRREIMEETGLTVEVGKPVFVGEWSPTIRGVKTQIIGIFFACWTEWQGVRLSEEHDHFEWIDPRELSRYDVMDPEPEAVAALLALT